METAIGQKSDRPLAATKERSISEELIMKVKKTGKKNRNVKFIVSIVIAAILFISLVTVLVFFFLQGAKLVEQQKTIQQKSSELAEYKNTSIPEPRKTYT